MSLLRRMINRPCKLHTTTVDMENRDDMGDPVESADSGITTVCEIQQEQATEIRDGRVVQVTKHLLLLLPGEPVNGWSELTVAPIGVAAEDWDGTGERYTLEGHPWEVRHPRTGVVHHIEAVAHRVS